MRLIDGDKLLEWLESDQFDSPHVYRIINAIKLGEFVIPSNLGEARLRDALTIIWFESGNPTDYQEAQLSRIYECATKALDGGNSDE